MKKFKVFFITAICAVCLCFAFAGCASAGSYVNNSFEYEFDNTYKGYYAYKVNFEFKVNVKGSGDYKIDYLMTYTTKDGREVQSKFTDDLENCSPNLNKTVSGHLYIEDSDFDKKDIIYLTISNIYPSNFDDKSVGYGIGFGVAGGLILGGVITLFVVLKVKKKI